MVLIVRQSVFDGILHAVIASASEAILPFRDPSAAKDCFVATKRLLAITERLISALSQVKHYLRAHRLTEATSADVLGVGLDDFVPSNLPVSVGCRTSRMSGAVKRPLYPFVVPCFGFAQQKQYHVETE